MRKQRGIADAWMILIGVIVLLAAITAAIKAWDSYISGIDAKGYARGEQTTKAAYDSRDNKALQAAIAERNVAQAGLDKAKKDNEKAGADSAVAYREGMKNAKAQYDRDLAAVKSGALVLRRPQGNTAITGIGEKIGGQGGTASCGPGVAGSGDDRLSESDSGFLFWLGGECNRLKDKANKLSDQVKRDRIQINGWNEYGHPILQMALTVKE